MNPVILFAAAGTGGHIRPAWVLAEQARDRGYDVVWIGSTRDVWRPKAAWPRLDLKMRGVRHRGVRAWLSMPFQMLSSVIQVFKFMRQHRPERVVLMGGYVTVPVAMVAKMMGVPYVLFEQNRVLCFSHRCALPWAARAYTGLPLVTEDRRVTYIGNPIPDDWRPTVRVPELPIRILVAGGSLGARYLNEVLPAALAAVPVAIEVVHICGSAVCALVQERYEGLGVPARCLPYQESMASWMAWADFAVMRSGALSVSESMQCHLPCVWVPYPHATDEHQLKNAEYLVALQAGLVVPEGEGFKEAMLRACTELCDVSVLLRMRQILAEAQYHFDAERFWEELIK